MKYKLVIWDVDGTMLDTSEGLLASAEYMINQMGYKIPSEEILYSFIGPRIQDSLSRVYGLEGKELNQAAAIFRDHYKHGDVLLAKPYDGIYDVLNALKKQEIHIAVATNKRQDFVDALMKKYNFLPYVEVVCGTDIAGKLKKVDLIHKCMHNFPKYRPDEVVMIGDSDYDAIAAVEAGISFIGVTYGFGFKNEYDIKKYESVACVENLRELLMKFTEWGIGEDVEY